MPVFMQRRATKITLIVIVALIALFVVFRGVQFAMLPIGTGQTKKSPDG